MKFLRLYEAFTEEQRLNGIDISLVCDIFADIMDQDTKIWVLQFPMIGRRKDGPQELNGQLTYVDCGSIKKLVYNKEYWFDIDVDIKGQNITDPLIRKELINSGEKLLNYDWGSISGRLTDIGLTVDKIERSETTRVSFSTSQKATEVTTGKIRIICRTI